MRRIAEDLRRIERRDVGTVGVVLVLQGGPIGVDQKRAQAEEDQQRREPPRIAPRGLAEAAIFPENIGSRRRFRFGLNFHVPSCRWDGSIHQSGAINRGLNGTGLSGAWERNRRRMSSGVPKIPGCLAPLSSIGHSKNSPLGILARQTHIGPQPPDRVLRRATVQAGAPRMIFNRIMRRSHDGFSGQPIRVTPPRIYR